MMPYPMRLPAAAFDWYRAMVLAAPLRSPPYRPRRQANPNRPHLLAESAARWRLRGAAGELPGCRQGGSEQGDVVAGRREFGVGCEQLATGTPAAARWQKLAPYSRRWHWLDAPVAPEARDDLAEARTRAIAWRESGFLRKPRTPVRFAEALQRDRRDGAQQRCSAMCWSGTTRSA